MLSARLHLRLLTLGALALCLASHAGCALDRLPRIDPTGERILIFPGDEPTATAAIVTTPTAVDPFTGAAPIVPPSGNLVASPVLGDSSSLCCLGRLFSGPSIIGPPVAAVAGAPQAQDRVVMTPERVLAPIGSEVVLRAGVCDASGYLQTNRRIDWGLGQQGVGQFVQLGDEGETDVLRWPWQRPNKIDNHYAIGYTTPFHTCIKRNAADPADDIQVRPGDAWVSVTSASEGVSRVTAFAPSVDDWAARKSSAIIYWVDAQWSLPPSVTLPAGQPHTLTTTVTRQSDGAPIAGWIVRYEVTSGGQATLGYEAGQATDATTDSQGRASIQVSPATAGAGAATVAVTIVRPDTPGAAGGPRINVGSGQATINWTLDAPATGLPPISQPGPQQPPVFQQPFDPGPPTPGTTPSPPTVTPQPAGRPNLQVQLRRDTPEPIEVGAAVGYTILVRNVGDGPARNIRILDRFDRGLSSPLDSLGRNQIEYLDMSDLGPGESDQVRVEFDVLEAGPRQTDVTVTADGATEAYDRDTFNARPIQQDPPDLRVQMVARPRYTLGEVTDVNDVRGVVENVGVTEATNVVVRIRYDGSLAAVQVEKALDGEVLDELADGYQWTIASLPPGAKRTFRVQSQFVQETVRSCVTLFVSADGGAERASEACYEVLPQIGASPAEGGGGPGPGAASGLQLSLASRANPAQVGRSSVLELFLVNNGATVQRQVVVEVALPQQVTPNLSMTQAPTAAQPIGSGVLRFQPILELAPGAREAILIPYDAVGQGRFLLQARASSTETPQGAPAQVSLEIAPR